MRLNGEAFSKKARCAGLLSIMPGLVAMVRGLGHSAFDAFVSGKGVNVNALMSPVEDPGTGLEAAWGVRAKLIKA